MGDTRAAYQNFVLVFNEAVQDAAVDPAVTNKTELETFYLDPAMNAMNTGFGPIIKCEYIANSFVGGTAEIKITCTSRVENSIETKFSAKFEKTVVFS